MRTQHGLLPRKSFLFPIALVATLFFGFSLPAELLPNSRERGVDLTFEDRLAFYLDQKSRGFLHELAVQEKLLLQMIRNITRELKDRGEAAVLQDQVGYRLIYGEADSLVTEYEKELSALLEILKEIQHLRLVVNQTNDVYTWEKLATLRVRLLQALEDRTLFKKGKYTEKRVRALIHDYNAEVDSVLALYDRLAKLKRAAARRGDRDLQHAVAVQMDSIQVLLGGYEATGLDTLTDAYMKELTLLVKSLNELNKLQAKAVKLDTEVGIEIEELRRSILASLDKRLLALAGYDVTPPSGPTVSEIVQEWKEQRYLDHRVHFTRYRIMKKSLLGSATPEQRTRMLERDLIDAFMNYVEKNYDLAEEQFNLILEDYGERFASVPAVLFYRAESYFARNLFDEAEADYQRIVTRFPDSEYLGDSLFRLLVIYEKFGNLDQFYAYFKHLKGMRDSIERSCYEKSNYLAGYVYLKDGKYLEAEEALSQVSKDSRYHMTARYLLGLVQVNRGNYGAARRIFEELASPEVYPWTDPKTVFLSNSARLKLGFIHYEVGEYETALKYFDQVSPGFKEYDKALLGGAWAHLKLKQYDQTVAYVNRLFEGYLASNYTYEALVLSAHSKKLLNREESALRDLRYVANARRILELADRYHYERRQVLDQLEMLDQLEEEILERRDENLYAITSQIRADLEQTLRQFTERGSTGLLVLEEYERERQAILDQIADLDKVVEEALANGNEDLAKKAGKQRARLYKTLEVYQADLNVRSVNYFIDYPLAIKEGTIKYRKGIVSDLQAAAGSEYQNLLATLQEVQSLKNQLQDQALDPEVRVEVELLEQQLQGLKQRFSRFQTWLAGHKVKEIKTDFDQWADFSGFGLSDITFATMHEKEKQVLELAQNRETITKILEQRKSVLEQRLRAFEQEVRRIEEELKLEKVEMEKKNREEYFEKSYFDTSDREVEGEGGF